MLVIAMVLATLPAISLGAGAAAFTATRTTEIPVDTRCVIHNVNGNAIMGYDITNGSMAGKYAQASEEGHVNIPNGAASILVKKNADGTYYLTIGGKYLTIDAAEALSLNDAAQATAALSSRWTIAYDSANGGFTISSYDVKYNNKAVYIEYYSSKGFCGYSYSSTNPQYFMFNFFVQDSNADPDGDGYIGTRPITGSLPTDGDTVVLYNAYAEGIVGPMNAETASSMTRIGAKVSNGVVDAEDGGLIFTVHVDTDGYYTFEWNGKFLANPENTTDASGNSMNAETLFLQDTQTEYTKWKLTAATGGYIMYNKTAKYKSSQVCIEYFGEAFSGWSYSAANSDYFLFNYYHVDDTADHMTAKPGVAISEFAPSIGKDCTVTVKVNDHKDISTISAMYAFDGAASGKTVTPTETDTKKVYTFSIPTAEMSGHSSVTVTVNTVNAEGGKGSASLTESIVDEPQILSYSPESASGTGAEKKPTIQVTFANAGTAPTVKMLVNDTEVKPTVTDGTAAYTFPTAQADGKVTVAFSITRKDGKTATKDWSFYIGARGLGLYFGQCHSHTSEYSDGAGTLEQAYEHASKAKDIDFLFVTDHSNYFDTTTTATEDSIYDAGAASLTKSTTTGADGALLTKWQEAKATAAKYTTDTFIAAYGYEMTWSGGPGHMNSFNTLGIVSRNNSTLNNKTNYGGMLEYYDLMVTASNKTDETGKKTATWTGKGQIVSMFNHPGTTFGTFGDFTGYTPTRDSIINLIEVGNGEGAVGGSSYWPSYQYYDMALAMGWHIAPSNNQDNHKGNWGDSNTCRDVVITDDFSEQGLYDALAARHTYATEDQNLNILYYLKADADGDGTISDSENYLQGDIINVESTGGISKVTLNVSFNDPDGEKLGKIEVIGEGGKSLWSKEITASSYEMNETLNNTDAYYYIKVTQADGDIAVTAPVWVGEPIAILFNGMTSSAALSVTGESETITAVFSNSSKYDFTATKLSYTVDGKSYFTDTKVAGTTVAAGTATVNYTLGYVPKTAGKHVIVATMTGTANINGKPKDITATKELTVKSYDAASLINVGVDKGHTNYYVSGDYANTANNFISFCADNGARCSYIEAGQFTYENLSKYKLVVLTVPYCRNAKAATMYTADEIAALKQYTDKGGNVIICSKSDRDNKYDNCANNSNALLSAIGAHSRIINGIIVDNELKANEAYRLYFSSIKNFNTTHRFTKGAYTSSNAFGTTPSTDNQTGMQVYNGGPVAIVDDNGNEISEAASTKVQVLVRGYDTTWGSHYDGYFTSGAFVPEYDESTCSEKKGNVNVMTYEDLPGGGWVVTSGVTFFSDYDIKSDVNYANKYILRNILNDLTGANEGITITPISTVKKTTETAKQFTIEGYVTSNASGYDKNTAFFDCIYVQDTNGNGINVFPVSGSYSVGMHVRVHGAVTYYCGEVELNTSDSYDGYVTILDDEINKIAPKAVTCKNAMANSNIGLLMQVTGTIKAVHKTEGIIDKIYVVDNSGTEACIFINGYILNSADKNSSGFVDASGNAVVPAPGMKITAAGIGSRDVDETSATSAIFARLRVRDRAEVSVSGTADYAFTFDDVAKTAWYYKPVQFVAEHGYMSGTGDRTFSPNAKLNRAMMVTILYSMEGKPSVTNYSNPFTDVAAGKYYTNAVIWAAAVGAVSGITQTTFAPMKDITREQMATIMYSYAKYKGYDMSGRDSLSAYADTKDISSYAVEPMKWCVYNGLISGITPTTLVPRGTATRAQFATIIMAFVKKFTPEAACTEHDYQETSRTEPTCTAEGTVLYTCSKCGATKTETIAALGHNYTSAITTAATCTATGVLTYTCSRCGDTYTEVLPMIDHNYVNGVCTMCGAKEPVTPTYSLVSSLSTGDVVVIYNATNKVAISSTMTGTSYLSGVTAEPVAEVITNADATIPWTVTVNDDGSYTFTQGTFTLAALANGTYFNLANTAGTNATGWKLTSCNAANNSYYISSSTLTGTYGGVYLEWYAKYSDFSAYCTSTISEANFGFQFYKLGTVSTDCDHSETELRNVKAATCTEDGYTGDLYCKKCEKRLSSGTVIAALGHNFVDGVCTRCGALEPVKDTFSLVTALSAGDQVIIYNPTNKKAVTSTLSGYYVAGLDLTADSGKIATDDKTVIWTVGVEADGSYTFTQGTMMLSMYQSGSYYDLSNSSAKDTKWKLDVCNAQTNTYYLRSATLVNGATNVYLEWYANKTAFSAYCTSSLAEANFGFQFYKLPCKHTTTEIRNAVLATCTVAGYTGDTYCTICGEKLADGEAIPALGHNFVSGICTRCGALDPNATTYTEIKDVTKLKTGSKYIITAQYTKDGTTTEYYLNDTAAYTNFLAANELTDKVNATMWTLSAGSASGTYTLSTSAGSLQWPSSTLLKVSATASNLTFAYTDGSGMQIIPAADPTRIICFAMNVGTAAPGPRFMSPLATASNGTIFVYSKYLTIYEVSTGSGSNSLPLPGLGRAEV
jgi:ribosomal protein L40E